jgi:hypothetical protein
MARKRKKSYRRRNVKRVIPLAATFVPSVITAYDSVKAGQGASGAATNVIYQMTGYNTITGQLDWYGGGTEAQRNGVILLGGCAVGIVGRKLGLNKHIPLPKGWKMF